MNVYVIMLIIQVVACIIIDLTGARENLIHPIVRFIFRLPKNAYLHVPLIDCSLCVGFWINIIILLIMGFTWLGLLEICGLALFSKNITGLLVWTQEALIKLEKTLYKIIE